jgi:hypothetical protein
VDTYGATVVYGKEADDYLASKQSKYTIISSVDKDLDTVAGKHFNELKPQKGVYEISEVDAQRNFYCQCLCGDSTDNIAGLFGVGQASALLRHIRGMDQELSMYLAVKEQYRKRFGSYWKLFMYENAQLLWLVRSEDNEEVIRRFEAFEEAA